MEETMKRLCLAAGLAIFSAGIAHAQTPIPRVPEEPYPDQARVVRAETKAKSASGACESELKAKHSGPACARYHAAVLDALQWEHKRFAWCNVRMSEVSNVPVPKACFGQPEDMRIGAVEELERKASPKTWKAFDDQMARYSN
jgi:hypothetical protein